MAQASKLQHHVFSNTAMPYVSNSSALSTDPQYISGSQNVWTNLRGQAQKREGFSESLENVASTFTNCVRTYLFEKWDGTFYAMFCDIAGVAKVYKYCIGHDNSAVLIYTASTADPFDFVFSNNTCYFGNGVDPNKKFLASTITDTNTYNMGLASQPAAPSVSLSGAGIDASVGYYYCTTGYNSTTGGESSPSPVSASTGTFSNKSVTITWTDPSDTQMDKVNVYKTPDGGSTDPTTMKLIATINRGVQTYTDSTWNDTALFGVIQTAPGQNVNDPMPPCKGFEWSQGRIWGMTNATVWFSGYEEITNGVPEETCPGGTLGIFGGGNNYNWPTKVGSIDGMDDGVAVHLVKPEIWIIEGDSLDTFRRRRLVAKRGAKYPQCSTSLGSSIAWIDSSNQVWLSDIGEIGQDIRPDLANLDQSKAYIAVHISGVYHWVCVLDGANGLLYLYDLDRNQWLPPWTVGSSASGMFSGETADGTIDLILCRNTVKALKFTPGTYTDDVSTYADALKTGMLWIAENSKLLEYYDRANPEWRATVDNIELKTAGRAPDTVSQLNDDDPNQASYTSISRIADKLLDVPQGKYIKINRYPSQPATSVGRLTSALMNWKSSSSPWTLYSIDIGYEPRGQ